jgi:hypothetical protein
VTYDEMVETRRIKREAQLKEREERFKKKARLNLTEKVSTTMKKAQIAVDDKQNVKKLKNNLVSTVFDKQADIVYAKK